MCFVAHQSIDHHAARYHDQHDIRFDLTLYFCVCHHAEQLIPPIVNEPLLVHFLEVRRDYALVYETEHQHHDKQRKHRDQQHDILQSATARRSVSPGRIKQRSCGIAYHQRQVAVLVLDCVQADRRRYPKHDPC